MTFIRSITRHWCWKKEQLYAFKNLKDSISGSFFKKCSEIYSIIIRTCLPHATIYILYIVTYNLIRHAVLRFEI